MQASTTDHPSHLIDQILQASAERQPLRTVGGNTKSFLGTPTTGTELATTDWSGIVSYEPTELVITAKAGTPLAEVEALLAGQGQCFPFEPPRFGPGGTVGGMVASGLAGPARATAGSVRD
ncbi:FAD-binding protein, partial [Hydrogenophaga sp.]